jgi:hypothetical protein
MDTAEAVSREEIRSLVASYNAFGDRGRVAELAGLFAPDGTLEIHGGESHVGPAAIEAYLGGVTSDNTARATYWRHFVATHDIEVIDAERATGTAYFLVIDGNGLNHWGRYRDRYHRQGDGPWRFAHRLVRRDDGVDDLPRASGPAGEA